MENATDRLTDSELDDLINEALPEVWEEIIQAGGKHKRTDTTPTSTTTGTQAYSLASDVLQVLQVKLTVNGVETELTNYSALEEAQFSDSSGGLGTPVYYAVDGDYLRFIPTPSGAFSFTYSYIPASPYLTGGASTFDGVHGWEKLAVFVAAGEFAAKNKEWDLRDRMDAMADKQRIRIYDQARRRDPLPPAFIDVRGLENRNIGRRWRFSR
jgi:hypothetical protein